MLDRKLASDLYLNLLVPWEKKFKSLPQTGTFDLRNKQFKQFIREVKLDIQSFESHEHLKSAIESNSSFGTEATNLLFFQKGDNSRARSIIRNLRNSIAHAQVEKIKINKVFFVIFTAEHQGKTKLQAQVELSKLAEFFVAVKSTVKSV